MSRVEDEAKIASRGTDGVTGMITLLRDKFVRSEDLRCCNQLIFEGIL